MKMNKILKLKSLSVMLLVVINVVSSTQLCYFNSPFRIKKQRVIPNGCPYNEGNTGTPCCETPLQNRNETHTSHNQPCPLGDKHYCPVEYNKAEYHPLYSFRLVYAKIYGLNGEPATIIPFNKYFSRYFYGMPSVNNCSAKPLTSPLRI
jgi:hypothetical protein